MYNLNFKKKYTIRKNSLVYKKVIVDETQAQTIQKSSYAYLYVLIIIHSYINYLWTAENVYYQPIYTRIL